MKQKCSLTPLGDIYLGGSLVAIREYSHANWAVQTVKYQHTDALGSPVAVTNEAGTVIDRTQYEPYGAAIGKPAYDGIGYTGHVMDGATGLTYMQQRYYDPQIGRFLSVDPVTANASTGANFNRYWYANNNPYKFTDPDGRHAQACKPGSCGASYVSDGMEGLDVNSPNFVPRRETRTQTRRTPNVSVGPVSLDNLYAQGPRGDPHGEPFVPDDQLLGGARDILRGHRTIDPNGRVILRLPDDQYRSVPLPRGGGFAIVRNEKIIVGLGALSDAVRVQPPGTGSVRHNPNGYYIVYNSYGQPISPYSGRPVGPEKAHNPIGMIVPGEN